MPETRPVSPFLHWLGKLLFRISGWKVEGEVPASRRFVIIAAPHTSNWDGILMVIASQIFGVRLSWFLKDSAFRGPFGPLVRFFGAIPINRSARRNVVGTAIEQFQNGGELMLAVAPEGTRGKSDGWKSGFYRIAHGAGVPIVLGYIDYKRRIAGLGPAFVPTGDIAADFQYFEKFYAEISPCYPEHRGAVFPSTSPDETNKLRHVG